MSTANASVTQHTPAHTIRPHKLPHVAIQTARFAEVREKQGAAPGKNLVGASLVKEDFAKVPVREWKTS